MLRIYTLNLLRDECNCLGARLRLIEAPLELVADKLEGVADDEVEGVADDELEGVADDELEGVVDDELGEVADDALEGVAGDFESATGPLE
ncbi:MAG: hypothetical protein Q9220_003810 [cf. Caloplaca sp. 1 TL-2023]